MSAISQLAPRQRAKRYKEQAQEARSQAAKSQGKMRAAFAEIARHWEQLALETDAEAGAVLGK